MFLASKLGGLAFMTYKSYLFARSIRSTGFLPPAQAPLAVVRDPHSPRGCWVSVFIDGAPIYRTADSTDAPDFNSIPVDEYAGVEFYPGGAAVPAQFNNTMTGSCVLLLWTRESSPAFVIQNTLPPK